MAVAACGPQSTISSSNGDPLLTARFSNMSVKANGDVTGAIFVAHDGTPVGLKNGDFIEVETRNGGDWKVAQSANVQTCTPGHVDVAVVADDSGSESAHVTEIRDAVKGFGDAMLISTNGTGNARAGLVRVTNGAHILSALTDSYVDFDAATDGLIETQSWTALWDGIRLGNTVLGSAPPITMTSTSNDGCGEGGGGGGEGQPGFTAAMTSSNQSGVYRAVVVFTDGLENNSSDEHQTGDDDGVATSYDDLLHLTAAGIATAIYPVGVGEGIDETALQGLADGTGGLYVHIDNWQMLPMALNGAATMMHYVAPMTFSPAACGTQARITVHTQHGQTTTVVPMPNTCN